MQKDYFEEAYENLICNADTDADNILYRLSDWLCKFLDSDNEKVLYYTLPIWDYLTDSWNALFPIGISIINDPSFRDQKEKWYKNNNEKREVELEGTTFNDFYSDSDLSSSGFSFVEFVTQNSTGIEPVFTIEFADDLTNPSTRFEFNKGKLKLFNNSQNSYKDDKNTNAFIAETYKLLTPDVNSLDPKNRNNLQSLYIFLCKYQRWFGKNIRYIYLITSRLYKSNSKDISSGGLILVCKGPINIEKLYFISIIVNLCYRERGGKNWANKSRVEAIKSAISAIMSRNMSHNLGSHYLYYTKTHLERLASVVSSKYSPDVRGAAKVLGYMQARMDYLATIISNDKYPYGCVNFKSQIYDELTIDDFSKRHFIAKLDSNNLPNQYNRTTNFLLSNLVLSEDFTRRDVLDDSPGNDLDLLNIQIKFSKGNKGEESGFKLFTGTNVEDNNVLDLILPGTINHDRPTMKSEAQTKNDLSLLNIALPGGTMSCHAFYNVIENFIRNSAKYCRHDFHTTKTDGQQLVKDLTITIAIRPHCEKDGTEDKKYVDFIVFDNKYNATCNPEYSNLLKSTKELYLNISKIDNSAPLFEESKLRSDIISQLKKLLLHVCNNNYLASYKEEVSNLIKLWESPSLLEQMKNRLSSIKILDDHNAVDKESKGLKEMIFSSAWMRAYTYKNGKTFAETIVDIHNANPGKEKIKLINDHCFELVAVKDDGVDITLFNNPDELPEGLTSKTCLGIKFTLPVFRRREVIKDLKDPQKIISESLKVYSDIVEIPAPNSTISKIYTRVYSEGARVNDVEAYASVLRKRFGVGKDKEGKDISIFDKYALVFGTKFERANVDNNYQIYFKQHLNAKPDELMAARVYAYADSVSGGNYTKTMEELYLSGLEDKSERSQYFRMQIKESALTRITLIDERFQKSMESHVNAENELSLKNIRVLTYCDPDRITTVMDMFKGNDFYDINNEYKGRPDFSHFISIHLGLIEKIVKSEAFCNFKVQIVQNKLPIIGEVVDNILKIKVKDDEVREYILDEDFAILCGKLHIEDRAKLLMELLRATMGGDATFVTVHSGRGNFSKELEGPLNTFPFISLSSLESAFNNSKMLLSQVFYNTRFVGKGVYNA